MNYRAYKWICGLLCLMSIIFYFIIYTRDWIDLIILGNPLFLSGWRICDILFLASTILLLVTIIKGNYKRLRFIYGVLASVGVVGIVIIIQSYYEYEYEYFLMSFLYILHILQMLLISIVAISLIKSFKNMQKKWLIAISVQLAALAMVMLIARDISGFLVYLPVLTTGLIINIRISKTAKYDNITNVFESLKKQYEMGTISDEEYTAKKTELISKIKSV